MGRCGSYSGEQSPKITVPDTLGKSVASVLAGFNKELAEQFSEGFKRYNASESTLRLDDAIPDAALPKLAEALKPSPGLRNLVLALAEVRAHPNTAKVKRLQLLPLAILQWLKVGLMDGWVYKASGDIHYAYIVTNAVYNEGDRCPPSVTVQMAANRPSWNHSGRENEATLYSTSITFHSEDIAGTVGEIMMKRGYLHETKELRAGYDKAFEAFQSYQPRKHHQFLAAGTFQSATEASYSRDGRWQVDVPGRVVNDESLLKRVHFGTTTNELFGSASNEDAPTEPPIHPTILCYDLERHDNVWLHALQMKPYVYDPSLRDKLVLPDAHRDLIEVLTADMDVFMEDVIAGKSGGTAILCEGAPGLGKTLTAEVYAEVIKRPLYRVHSGQLGTTAKAVEESLETILKRAQRWGAVLLIDEADVYIRKRGDDIEHNAVVAGFLRTLEYFSGLLFLTTNRTDDVDDAILSRMVAKFHYEPPKKADAEAIWRIMATEFQVTISDALIKELTRAFNLSGRDIKNLLKLAAKYSRRKKVPLNFEAFRVCAMFRGLV